MISLVSATRDQTDYSSTSFNGATQKLQQNEAAWRSSNPALPNMGNTGFSNGHARDVPGRRQIARKLSCDLTVSPKKYHASLGARQAGSALLVARALCNHDAACVEMAASRPGRQIDVRNEAW